MCVNNFLIAAALRFGLDKVAKASCHAIFYSLSTKCSYTPMVVTIGCICRCNLFFAPE